MHTGWSRVSTRSGSTPTWPTAAPTGTARAISPPRSRPSWTPRSTRCACPSTAASSTSVAAGARCCGAVASAAITASGWSPSRARPRIAASKASRSTRGAFEHFAARRAGQDERRAQYTRFFGYCAQRLPEGGRLYLQTIGFMAESILEPDRLPKAQWLEIARRMHPVRQEWHNSMPPTSLTEILAAADREFEVVSVRARRHDYARTCAEWLARLQQRRDEALALAGEKTVRRFESYLGAAGPAFDQGLTNLYQIVFSKRESLGALSAVP